MSEKKMQYHVVDVPLDKWLGTGKCTVCGEMSDLCMTIRLDERVLSANSKAVNLSFCSNHLGRAIQVLETCYTELALGT